METIGCFIGTILYNVNKRLQIAFSYEWMAVIALISNRKFYSHTSFKDFIDIPSRGTCMAVAEGILHLIIAIKLVAGLIRFGVLSVDHAIVRWIDNARSTC